MNETEQVGLSPGEVVRFLSRYRLYPIVGAVVGSLVFGSLTVIDSGRWVARASFQPSAAASNGSSFSLGGGLSLPIRVPGMSQGQPLEFYDRMLRSNDLLWQIVSDDSLGGDSPANQRLNDLRDRLTVSTDGAANVVNFAVRAESAAEAVNVARELLSAVSSAEIDRRQERAREERIFLEGRLTEARNELERREEDLARFLAENRDVRSPNLSLSMARLERGVTLAQESYLSLSENLEQARLAEVRGTPSLWVIQAPELNVSRRIPLGLGLFAGAAAGAVIGVIIAGAVEAGRMAAYRGDP